MDSINAIALFIVISILLVAMMAGGNDPGKDNKANKSKRGGGSPCRVVTTSTENTPLVPSSRTLPAPGGDSPHIGCWTRTLIGTAQGANGPTAASGTSSTAGPSVLSSPLQVRKRGRDQETPRGLGSTLPPLPRGTNTGSVPPPPPPPPLSAPAPGQVAPAATDNEVIWYRCSLCPRGFTSSKGLCGHMRAHPYREWRGAHPPPTFSWDEFLGAPGIGPSSQVGAEVPLAEHHTVPPGTPAKASTSGTGVAENTNNVEQGGGQAGGGGGGDARAGNELEQKPCHDFDLNELPPENEGSQ